MGFLPDPNTPNSLPMDSSEAEAVEIAQELTLMGKDVVDALASNDVNAARKLTAVMQERIIKLDPANNRAEMIAIGTLVLSLSAIFRGGPTR